MLQHAIIYLFIQILLVALPSTQGAKTKCYGIFGEVQCFSTSSPFTNTFGKKPESPTKQGVSFALFTPGNTQNPQYLNGLNSMAIAASRLDDKKITRVIIHGFRHSAGRAWVQSMTREIIKNDGSNVILVNWSKGAAKSFLNYWQAAANTRVVGALLAKMITLISTAKKVPYNRFHLIGHSLGAHIAGYAGRRLSGKIGRISGLDPAGPAFEKFSTKVRLDKSDAMFVDVIHTDGAAGISKAIGDADFFPNGGKNQPGCKHSLFGHLKNLFNGGIRGLGNSLSCDHMRVLDLYTESINTECSFRACRSTVCSRMGFHANKSKKGSFSLKTNSKSPFCKG